MGGKVPKGYIPYNYIYVTFMTWKNFRNKDSRLLGVRDGSGGPGRELNVVIKGQLEPGQCGTIGWRVIPYTKRSQVRSQVSAHT